jgi:RsiW-degrading membrane proteinase PrsW (M82 family)
MQTSYPWQLLGAVTASALFWMQYVDLKDHLKPEPRRRLISAFLLGLIACGVAIFVFNAAERLGLPTVDSRGPGWVAAFCFLLIGPIEEGVKIFVAYLFVFRWSEFDEPIDGFVYAAAISLGFASLENLYNLPSLPLWEQLARTAALPLTHTLFAAVWGFGIAHARVCVPPGHVRRMWEIGTIVLAMFLHSLYDFLLFAYQATLLTSNLILVIWGCVIYRARAIAKRGGLCKVPSTGAAASGSGLAAR